MRKELEGKRVGVALASGAARGWAHIGALEVLEEAGVEVCCVAGTSIGALVGASWCSGKLPALRRVALSLTRKGMRNFYDLVFPRTGLIDGERLARLFREEVMAGSFEELAVPFRAVATDLRRGEEVVFSRGDLIGAVRASISIPGIFTPVVRGGVVLVDGVLTNPLPVSVARAMGAEAVIAVDLTYGLMAAEKEEPPPVDPAGLFEVVGASYFVMESSLVRSRLQAEPADLLVRPRVGHIGPMEFHRAEEARVEGRRAMREALEAWQAREPG